MHLMEPRDVWARYADPADRDVALRLDEDELGHTWLWHGDRRLELAFRQVPGDTEQVGAQLRAVRNGEPADCTYEEANPASYRDPSARLSFLDSQGIDAAVLFPNYGLVFEGSFLDDLRSMKANMGAWNRYTVEVTQQGGGRLFPVAHLTLRDPEWLVEQLAALESGGVRLAMISPAEVDGRRLSHPDHDPMWAAFGEHGVSPVFHVGSFKRPFADAWYEDDPDRGNPVLSSVFLGTAAALAIADLAVHGTFERFPDLRLGIMELSAVWVPLFLLQLDGGFDFHRRFNGAPLTDLSMKPSEYIRRQVRIAAFSYEGPDRLISKAGDLFMFCSDYPHSEGTAHALDDYARMAPRIGGPDQSPAFYADNVAWLLRQG
jgi:predicted TIM-barrel fold metal-dependent hydrolase